MTLSRFLGRPKHLITGSLALIAAIATGLLLFGYGHDSREGLIEPVAHGSHSAGIMTAHDVPGETGQSAFAAVAEIVAMLEADPKTDWSRVDITALREHLVDMDQLMLGAEASASFSDHTAVFSIRGDGPVLRAIQAMVPAHAIELSRIDGWDTSTTTTEDGAALKIAVTREGELAKIKALGFFGVMALGAHHQPHHLAMARGDMGTH